MQDHMGTMSVPSKTLCCTSKGWKCGYLVFDRKRLEPRELPWQWHHRCHFVSTVMFSSGAKFEDYCPNNSRDILDSVVYNFSCTGY